MGQLNPVLTKEAPLGIDALQAQVDSGVLQVLLVRAGENPRHDFWSLVLAKGIRGARMADAHAAQCSG